MLAQIQIDLIQVTKFLYFIQKSFSWFSICNNIIIFINF